MKRPLVVSDCDEVLLHMIRHFSEWLDSAHDIEFRLAGNPFEQSMRRRGADDPIEFEEVRNYLKLFFETEMYRQTAIEGAAKAIAEMQREADVAILTNLEDEFNLARVRQLQSFGIDANVFTNQGPKGEALRRIVQEHGADRVVFIDDLAHHHASVGELLPHVRRLHFCGEPTIASHVPCALEAGDAHARIDNWDEALPWVLQTLHGKHP